MPIVDTNPPPTIAQVAALQPFQGLWRGLTFGDGTDYVLPSSLEGLFSYEGRLGDAAIPQGDGDIPFARYAGSRYVAIPFFIMGPPLSATLESRVDSWLSAFDAYGVYDQDWLVWKTVTKAHMWRARVSRRDVETEPTGYKSGRIPARLEIKLADPRTYDATTRPGKLLGIGAGSGGGFDLGAEIPIDMASTDAGATTITNTGRVEAWPVLQVSNDPGAGSDITQVVVTNITSGVVATFTTDIVAGQTLVADFSKLQRRSPGPHIHIDGASRYTGWEHPRLPLGLLPGSNLITVSATGGTPVARLDWYNTSL